MEVPAGSKVALSQASATRHEKLIAYIEISSGFVGISYRCTAGRKIRTGAIQHQEYTMIIVMKPDGLEQQAQLAQEHFAANGPPDAPRLPLSYDEREDLKTGGRSTIVALFARSWEGQRYNLLEHPAFDDYARGVMTSDYSPDFIKNDPALLRRFPPRSLPGLGPGLCWQPPKSQKMAARSEAA
jgi:hypothetical protein